MTGTWGSQQKGENAMHVGRSVIVAVIAALVGLGAARADGAAPSLESQLQQQAERLSLEGRKGPSLFQPGFGVGEYSGWSRSSNRHVDAGGIFSSDKASASLEVQRPGLAPITGACGGGQGRIGLDWITFQRDRLSYVCTYGGGAPPGTEFDLAEASGGLFAQLRQPQRAGELRYGTITLRAQTRHISGLPISGGGANSYVVTRPDGTPVAGLQTNGLRPIAWLPRAPGPERDAAALLLLTLFTFHDPGKQGGWPF
jgi:hypothetical protein